MSTWTRWTTWSGCAWSWTGSAADGDGPADGPDTTAAWAALEQAVIGKAVDLLSGPGGLASFLRRRQLGVRLGGPSLPLDIGYAETIPAGIRNAVLLRDRHCQWAGGCTQPAGGLRGAPHHAQSRRRQDLRQGLRTAVPLPPPDRDPPLGLDAGREPGRDDQRVEQEQDQSAAQPRTTRPRRVTAPARCAAQRGKVAASTSRKWVGSRPSSCSSAGSTAANSPLRLAANIPGRSSRTAPACPARPGRFSHASSETVTRVIRRPVSSEAIAAMPAKSSASGPVSAGVIPSRRPSSVSAIAAASARSACAVQETGPSSGGDELAGLQRRAPE